MFEEEIYSWENCIELLKVLIAGTVATPKVKKLWSHINTPLLQKPLYPTVGTVIAHLPELQQDDLMAWTVRRELATPNVNDYSVQSVEPWSEIEGVHHSDGKPYIPGALRADLLDRNHDDFPAGTFGVKKTLELLSRRYYWPEMRADIEKYVCSEPFAWRGLFTRQTVEFIGQAQWLDKLSSE